MFPTKSNFKGRWGTECNFCNEIESDVHLFSCAGYSDLLHDVRFDMFMTLHESMEDISSAAKKPIKVKERLDGINSSAE